MVKNTTISTMTASFWDLFFPPSDTELHVRALRTSDFHGLSVPETPESWIQSALPYQHNHVHDLVYALKFERSLRAASLGARILADELTELLSEKQLFGKFSDPVLCPIPLSQPRLKERQYNQCKLLLSRLPNKDSYTIQSLLSRTTPRVPQSHTSSRQERLENVKGTFQVRNPQDVWNQDIILIDDVTTTGATLREARRALLAAGAKNVIALTLAH